MVSSTAHGAQILKATPQHARTANARLRHQTTLKYKTAVSDGGRLELKTPLSKGTRVVLFAAQESPDNFSDLTEASESTLEFWDNPIDDQGLERFCPIGWDKYSRFRSHYL